MRSAQIVYLHGKFNEHQEITRVACTDDTLLIPTFVFTPYYNKILEAMDVSNLSTLQAAYPVRIVEPALRFLLGFQEYLPKKTQRQLKKWGIILNIKNGKIVAECNHPNEESSPQCGERNLYNSCAINTSRGKRYINAAMKHGVEPITQDYHFMCCIGSIILNENTIEQASANYGIPLARIKDSMNGINVTRSIENNQNIEHTKVSSIQKIKSGDKQNASDDNDRETKFKKRKFVRKYKDKKKKSKSGHGSMGSSECKEKTFTFSCNEPEAVNEYKVVTSPVSETESPEQDLTPRVQESPKLPSETESPEQDHTHKVQEPPGLDQTANQVPYDGSQCIQHNLSSFPIDVSYDYFDNIDDVTPYIEPNSANVFMGINHQDNHMESSGEPCAMRNQSVPKMEIGPENESQSINTPPSRYDEYMGTLWDDIANVLGVSNCTNSLDWMKDDFSSATNPQY